MVNQNRNPKLREKGVHGRDFRNKKGTFSPRPRQPQSSQEGKTLFPIRLHHAGADRNSEQCDHVPLWSRHPHLTLPRVYADSDLWLRRESFFSLLLSHLEKRHLLHISGLHFLGFISPCSLEPGAESFEELQIKYLHPVWRDRFHDLQRSTAYTLCRKNTCTVNK